MRIDISKKRIIMIHGLASKPPESDFLSLWKHCVVENIRATDKKYLKPEFAAQLADQIEQHPEIFVSGYWANATPHHIEDDSKYVKKLKVQVNKVVRERKRIKDKFHVGTKDKIGSFFKGRGLDLANLLTSALTIKDDVMKSLLRETELYDNDQYIADRMRGPLEAALRRAWADNCDVAILSHSMGTFIAYDALWRFSHRRVEGFRKFSKKRVQLLVTMGSPLGDSVIKGILFGRHHEKKSKRQYPTNIDFWHNYACLGDVVAHQHNFTDEYFEPMRKLGVFPEKPKYRAIDYTNLHNPFEVVTHADNKAREKRNPHKSYGYLVQPRLGTWLVDFLLGKLKY